MTPEAERSENQTNTDQLELQLSRIWTIAKDFGMDPYPTEFTLVPPHIMHELASYGLPDRFSHWTHGRAHRQIKTMYDHGLARFYEIVINADPSQAFLLDTNDDVSNTLVMAHVLGHTEFNKHNYLLKNTRKDMPRIAKLHAERIRAYEDEIGEKEVEEFIDAVLTLEWHVDIHTPDRLPAAQQLRLWRTDLNTQEDAGQLPTSEYDVLFDRSGFIGPKQDKRLKIPPTPDRDILGFIHDFSPVLTDWQRDIVDMIRQESLYFWPQRLTKIMNEGWASLWHKTILREMGKQGFFSDADSLRWATLHSGIVRPDPKELNPYHLGMITFEYIIDYYNGNLTEEEKDWLKQEKIPIPETYIGPFAKSPGLAEARHVMREHNDQSFIRTYFNKIVADRANMYIYDTFDRGGDIYYIIRTRGWEQIRDMLVANLNNSGQPYIVVADADFGGRGELLLDHVYEGRELEASYTEKTLPYAYKLWGKPVHLETTFMGEHIRFSFDGKQVTFSDADTKGKG